MKRIVRFTSAPRFISYSAVGGYEERRGPLGSRFDLCDVSDMFGQKTFELAEGEMGRCALNLALQKCSLSHEALDLLVAGDLQNQCVATSVGLESFGVPFLGVYGACSTCTEALLVASVMLCTDDINTAATVTSSHNAAAERQFRGPVEYGALRAPSSQWTSTAAGAFILTTSTDLYSGSRLGNVAITEAMAGRVIDGATADATNMGGAMSFAAADSILSFFEESGHDPREVDLIVTGDLGRVGSDLLRHILRERLPAAASRHMDCGLMLYDGERSDVHSGASGCGTSASVLASHFLPLIERGELKSVLFLSTGAMMSPSSVLQGSNIAGVAPLIHLRHSPRGE